MLNFYIKKKHVRGPSWAWIATLRMRTRNSRICSNSLSSPICAHLLDGADLGGHGPRRAERWAGRRQTERSNGPVKGRAPIGSSKGARRAGSAPADRRTSGRGGILNRTQEKVADLVVDSPSHFVNLRPVSLVRSQICRSRRRSWRLHGCTEATQSPISSNPHLV